jgi:hypothetical protein
VKVAHRTSLSRTSKGIRQIVLLYIFDNAVDMQGNGALVVPVDVYCDSQSNNIIRVASLFCNFSNEPGPHTSSFAID